MLNLRKTQFVRSAPNKKFFLTDRRQVVFLGKSNVGKSTLLNTLCDNRNLAKTSSTPGRTQMMNYFLTDDKFYLVDAPGYGYYKDSKLDFGPLMDDYLKVGPKLIKRAYILLDSRRKITVEDKVCINLFYNEGISIRIVYTKTDKINQSQKAAALKDVRAVLPDTAVIWTSSAKKDGFDYLRSDIAKALE